MQANLEYIKITNIKVAKRLGYNSYLIVCILKLQGTTGSPKVILQGAATYTNAGQRRKLYCMNEVSYMYNELVINRASSVGRELISRSRPQNTIIMANGRSYMVEVMHVNPLKV